MTKISVYNIDEYVTADDKWIGTDVNTYNKTKNFTPRKLSHYFNNNQVINTGVDLLYKYFTITPPETRPTGTLSFETEIGSTVNFSTISTFLLSKTTLKGNYIVEFFDFLVGTNVLLYKAKNINLFGSYKIVSVEEYLPEPNFFVVNVEFIDGNGFIEEDEDYMISLIDISGGGGDSPITIENNGSLFSTGLDGTGVGSDANYSTFFGLNTGFEATDASNSIFIGQLAGSEASSARNSNFLGWSAGQDTTNANYSNFLGNVAGSGATDASYSNFFGVGTGYQSINVSGSNFFGYGAGGNTSGASYSTLIGYEVGRANILGSIGSNNIIIGTSISLPTGATNSINIGGVLFGTNTNELGEVPSIIPSTTGKIGIGVVEPTNTLHIYSEAEDTSGLRLERLTSSSPTSTGQAIGVDTDGNVVTVEGGGGSPITIVNTNSLFSTGLSGTGDGSDATNSIFLGDFAGEGATNAAGSNFFGYNAGAGAINAYTSNFIGSSAGGNAENANNSNFFGDQAGQEATNASASNFFGQLAGNNATDANNSNFFGKNTGYNASNASYSNLFGYNVGANIGTSIGSNNIIIGTNISLPPATSNSINLGGVLFGTGTYSTVEDSPSIIPISGGKIGIGVVEPTNTLHIYSEAEDTSGLRLERLTSSSPTTTGQAIGVDASGNVVTVNGGGGGSQDLQSVTDEGETTTNNIQFIDSAEVIFGAGGGILLDNTSRLREGTIDAGLGGSKGIAQICGVGYELKWEAGRLYVMNGNGNGIRESLYNFNIVPTVDDDNTKAYYQGSLWSLDNGDVYECADATTGAAVWFLKSTGSTPTLQEVTDEGATTTNSITVTSAVSAITGNSTEQNGITGTSVSGTGIVGTSVDDVGVYGSSTSAIGGVFNTVNGATIVEFQTNSVLKASINNAGELTAQKLIKEGGTSSQILAADGEVITAGTNITIIGGQISSVGGAGGGGSSVNYYLNGGTSQGTFGGSTYYEFSKTAIIGTGADFNINTNGYIASFITDVADPSLLLIPAGNWNLEFFFSSSSAGGSPSFYVELYKYDGTTFTSIASSSANPEGITGGTAIDAYFTPLAVPETVLTVNDRLAIRVFVNASSKTITLHTQNGHLCEVITTFTTGLTALNGLQAQVQNFATGTTGTDFDIVSSGSTHTFNLPSASATARGVVTTGSQTFAGDKTFTGSITSGSIVASSLDDYGVSATSTNSDAISAESTDGRGVFGSSINGLGGYFNTVNGANIAEFTTNFVEKAKIDSDGLITGTGLNASGQTINTIASFDANKNVVSLPTATYPSLAELALVKGVTSAIQTQLNAKAPLASPTFTGTVVLPSTTSIGTVSSTEIGYLDNVTSSIQTQLDNKIAKNVATTYTTNTITTVTAAEYAAIGTKDANTLYFIV